MLSWLGRFLSSSIGKKTIMALTGLALVGFLVIHVLGNLNLWIGGDKGFNDYAHHLLAYGWLLTVGEVALGALFLIHIIVALALTRENLAARNQRYGRRQGMGNKTAGSATMLITGLVMLVFIVIHVIDFRVPVLRGEMEDLAQGVRERLAAPLGAGIYLVALVALGLHLSHAVQSGLQTLGVHHPRWTPTIRTFGLALAVIVAVVFATFPFFLFIGGAS